MFPSRIASVLGGGTGLLNNYSVSFDGTNDYVDIGNASDLNFTTGSFSIAAWIKTSAAGSNDGIVCKDLRWQFIMDSSNKLHFALYDGTNNPAISSATSINTGEWTHVAAVRHTSDDKLYVYVDGVLDGSATDSLTASIASSDTVDIGRRQDSGEFFNGNIDEVSIWNKALSAGDISALYQAKGTSDLNDDGNSANLQGWWRMGDGRLDDFNLIADQVNPTLGSELWDSPASTDPYTSGSWVAQNNNTLSDDGDALKITYVDHDDGAKIFLKNADDLSTDLTVGKVYKFVCDIKVTQSSPFSLRVNDGSTNYDTSLANSDWQTFTTYFTAQSTTGAYVRFNGMGSGEIAWIDNLSLKPVNGNAGLMTNMASDDIVKDTP